MCEESHWVYSGISTSVPPEVMATVLEHLQDLYGIIRPKDLVYEARRPESPIHAAFEWEDSVAAEQYRLIQARRIIRTVRWSPPEPSTEPVRFFVHVKKRYGQGYLSTSRVVENTDLVLLAVAKLQGKIKSLEKSISDILKLVKDRDPRFSEKITVMYDLVHKTGNIASTIG